MSLFYILFSEDKEEEKEEEEDEEEHRNLSNAVRTLTTIASNILVDITMPIG